MGDDDLGGVAHHAGLDVRRRVSLVVTVVSVPWNHPVENGFHVRLDVGIGIFVDGYGRRRVWNEDGDDAFRKICFAYDFRHLPVDVDEIRSGAGL